MLRIGGIVLAGLVLAALAPSGRAGEVDLPRMPSISPDGEQVVFSWRGDLWKVPSTGGQAERITAHPADDSRSAWSPDGSTIAFNSNRTGALEIHLMDADGGNVRQLTHDDLGCVLTRYCEGGKVTFQAAREGDVYSERRPYWISDQGGPIHRLHDAFGRTPVLSADGTKVAFSRGGSGWSRRHYRGPASRDVWLHDQAGGAFTRLTHWRGNDGMARFDGAGGLLYVSDQELATVNLYRLSSLDGKATPVRLTSFEGTDLWSWDVTPSGSKAVLHVWDTLYTLDLTAAGSEPVPLTITAPQDDTDRFALIDVGRKVSEARLSPDGKVMATIAYGDVFVRHLDDEHPTRRVTSTHARERYLRWSPDGLRLYFTSDSDGTESIYAARVTQTRGEIKEAFEKATKPPEEPPKEVEEKPEAKPKKNDGKGSDVGGDGGGKKKDDKDDAAKEKDEKDEKKKKDPAFDPERWHDAVAFATEPVVQTEHADREPWPSPDGKSLAFRRGLGNLMVLDLATGSTRELRRGWDQSIYANWSPDSHHIAFHQQDRNFNSDIWIVRADGSSPPVNITRHPAGDSSPRWSADGKILTFESERKNREFDVYRVHLDKKLEGLSRLELDEYYADAAKAAKKRKPLEVPDPEDEKKDDDGKKDEKDEKDADADAKEKADEKEKEKKPEIPELDLADAYKRLTRVTTLDGHERGNELTPAGDRIVFAGKNGTDSGIFSVKWDGSGLKKLGGSGWVQHMSFAGDKVVWVAGGQAYTANPASGGAKAISIQGKVRIDLEVQSSQKFHEAARVVGEVFYHPTMKGLDWPALTERYHELARRARTGSEFNDVAGRFLGELNASHLGIRTSGYSASNAQPSGRLGIDAAPVEGGFRVNRVVPYGPADKDPMRLIAGDVITAIDLEPLTATDTLELRLRGRVGQEVILAVRRPGEAGADPKELKLLLTPTSYGAERGLRYDDWQTTNARLVDEWSKGRLGYLHIRGMNQRSLDEFERDLFAAAEGKDGLLVDVRNNGGGSTADRVLASIMVQPHAYTVPRGADPEMKAGYPRDRLFIQRYVLPMNMLCNEKSFSNAEIVSHAFKTLKRGRLVGQQTYGGVISTSGTTLIDGTWVRTPFRGWYLPDGTDMENNGAMPDIHVPQTPEAESRGDDEQLRAAVDDLLERL